jgi:hypothetical protein
MTDMNGFSTDNTHDGTVFVFGDMNIEGNLTVGGTYPGGGGSSGVQNPMIEDLNAGNNKITNLSEITGFEGVLKTSLIDVQNNDIYHVSELRGRSDDNKLYISGNVEILEDLDMTNKSINNVNTLEIKSLTTPDLFIDCNSKNLSNLQSIQLNNGLAFSASIVPEENYVLTVAAGSTIINYKKAVFNPAEENVNMDQKSILNLNTLDTDIITSSNSSISFNSKGISNVIYIGSPNGGADTITLNGDIRSINGNFLDGITNITGYGSGDVLYLNGEIRISNSLNLLSNNITTINNTETKGISSSTGAVAFTSILNMFNDINMNLNDIFNVERITTTHAGVNLNLDLVPATEGKASQVLARNPAYDPLNIATHKLVWQTPSGGGGITNPMTANLQAAQFNIYDSNTVECRDINIMVGGAGLACANAIFPIPITWGLALKKSTSPFYQTFNTDYITPATNLGITIDSKAPDGITDSKITLSAPNIILNNSTNLAPSLVTITGNLQITNSSGYIHGNNLIVRGRNASAVPTPITIEGTTTSINSSTLNITSSTSNNFLGAVNTNFSGTVRTNTIDANSGGNISILQNLSLAVGKFLQTPQIFTDAVRSLTNTDLIIAGFLPDNKTQTNIILASPQISLNNQLGPLTADTQVAITGNIVFNNPVTNPYIHGSNLIIRGRTPAGVATQLTIEGTATAINSSTLNIFSTLNNNINGPTNFDRNINVLSARSSSIGVRTTLFKTFGAMPLVDINTLTPIKINSTIANQKGTNLIPAGGFVNGDKFIIVMYGLLTTLGGGSLNILVAVGGTPALTFNVINAAITNQVAKFTIEMDCTVSGTNVNLANSTALLSAERFNTSIRFSTTTASNIVDNSLTNNTIDIFMYQTSAQASSFTPLSYTIEQM